VSSSAAVRDVDQSGNPECILTIVREA